MNKKMWVLKALGRGKLKESLELFQTSTFRTFNDFHLL